MGNARTQNTCASRWKSNHEVSGVGAMFLKWSKDGAISRDVRFSGAEEVANPAPVTFLRDEDPQPSQSALEA